MPAVVTLQCDPFPGDFRDLTALVLIHQSNPTRSTVVARSACWHVSHFFLIFFSVNQLGFLRQSRWQSLIVSILSGSCQVCCAAGGAALQLLHGLLAKQSWRPRALRDTRCLFTQHRGPHVCMAAPAALHPQAAGPARGQWKQHDSHHTSPPGCAGCAECRVGCGWGPASEASAVEACWAPSHGPIAQAGRHPALCAEAVWPFRVCLFQLPDCRPRQRHQTGSQETLHQPATIERDEL